MPKPSLRRRALAVTVALGGVASTVVAPVAAPALAEVAPGTTVRASVVDGTGAESDLGAYQQELAAGGGAVVFTSDSRLDDLATSPDGTGYANENVYVRDLATGRTVMISRGQFVRDEGTVDSGPAAVAPQPREVPPDQDSYQPTISADGRYVAFVTAATNIVPGDADHDQDILVCDRDPDGDGVFDEDRDNGDRDYRYFRVTAPRYADDSDHRHDDPRRPRLSDDATRIVWEDREYVDGDLLDQVRTALLRRTPEHDPGPPVAAGPVDTPLAGEVLEHQYQPDVSGDGRFVVLTAGYRIPTQDPYDEEVRHAAVLRVDTGTGALARLDVDGAGRPIGTGVEIFLSRPVISRDGSVVAFEAERYFSRPCDGVCWDRSGLPDVHLVRAGQDGSVTGSAVVSRDNAGDQVNGTAPGLSGDGRFVSFVTDNHGAHDGVDDGDGESCLFRQDSEIRRAPRAAARELRTTCQVVVRDVVADRERVVAKAPRLPGALASPGTGRCADPMPAGGSCGGDASTVPYGTERSPSMSADGSHIAYESDATDLVRGEQDGNQVQDVFVRTFRPSLRADPNPLNFGDVLVGSATTATVRVAHVGIGPLRTAGLEVDGDAFTVLDQTCVREDTVLQQGGECLVEVEFLPTAETGFTGRLRVVLGEERELVVDLTGAGVPEPPEADPAAFTAGPDPVNFGSRLVRSTGPNATVTVTNAGGTPLTVSAVTVEPPAARQHYTVVANTCAGGAVAPGAKCTVTVRLVPTASGDLPAVLSFVDNAAGSPHLVGLRGSAPTPEIVVSPAVTQPGRVVTVTGTGFAPGRQVVASAAQAVQTSPVSTAADGTFRSALLVLPKATVGTRTVVATVTVFPEVNAEQSLLVVTPTVGPAEFVVRG